jgi:DNA primase
MSAAMDTWAASSAFARLIEALERHGSRVTGNGRQRKAQCPHHEDRDPSLSITDGEARVLVHCFGECGTDDVLTELGLTRRDLFDSPRERLDGPSRRVVAEYPYTDEHGALLFVKVRYMPKDFRVKRPDGHGGWTWGLAPETPRVLYRLPRILAAPPSACIFLVEGERDVHALEAIGEIATCNFDGASGSGERPKWRADYSPVLAGRDVLIVADRDEEGRIHARYVAACLEGIARFCWIVEAAAGKDAADHLAAGLGVTDFAWWS